MGQTPISQKQVDRFVELVAGGGGFRLTQNEAARAVKISERSGERLFAKPEIRARVDQLRKGRLDVDSAVRGVVADLLEAKTHDGERWTTSREGCRDDAQVPGRVRQPRR